MEVAPPHKNYKKLNIILHISSSYAKILGETNFHTWEFPQSGSKVKEGDREKKERLNDGNNNGKHIANATSGGARKAA